MQQIGNFNQISLLYSVGNGNGYDFPSLVLIHCSNVHYHYIARQELGDILDSVEIGLCTR